MTYYENSCKFYYDHLQAIAAEKKMAKKLALGAEIPEFFFFYLAKIGIKSVPNSSAKNEDTPEGSFFELVKFITSLEASGKGKEGRLALFRKEEPSWYSQELLRMIAEQKVAIGIGKKKLEEILDTFVPLRRPEEGEEYSPDDDYAPEPEADPADLSPLEEAERYKTYIMRASPSEQKTRPMAYPAMVQKKYDGTRRLVFCTGNNVFTKSRNGKSGIAPPQIEAATWVLWETLGNTPGYCDGFVLDGEFYTPGVDRATSNGAANKKDVDEQTGLIMAVWDFIPLDLYRNYAELEQSLYRKRYNNLVRAIGNEEIDDLWESPGESPGKTLAELFGEFPLEVAEWWEVDSHTEAVVKAKELAAEGEEGGVLKDFRLTFKNDKSPYCIKLKQVFDCNLTITGINPGEGKFAGMVGSFAAESLDGELKVNVSGMADEVRLRKKLGKEANNYWIGKVINIKFLELNNKNTEGVYRLHSPQFVRINEDVEEADDLAAIKEIVTADLV